MMRRDQEDLPRKLIAMEQTNGSDRCALNSGRWTGALKQSMKTEAICQSVGNYLQMKVGSLVTASDRTELSSDPGAVVDN